MRIENILVLICDGTPDMHGEVIDLDSSTFADVIPVRLEFDPLKPIGTAKMRRDGNRLYADIDFVDGVNPDGLIPAIGGQYLKTWSKDELGQKVVWCRVEIYELGICSSGNADGRIPPIKS